MKTFLHTKFRWLKWRTFFAVLLILGGAAAIGIAILADVLGNGHPGFGDEQLILALIGIAAFVGGVSLVSSSFLRYIAGTSRSATAGQSLRAGSVALICVWFALVAGLSEVAVVVLLNVFMYQFKHFTPHSVWMTPLAVLSLFGIVGLLFLLIGWRYRRLLTMHKAVLLFSFLGFMSLLFLYPRLHRNAALLLAAGLAVFTARLISRHPLAFLRMLRRSILFIMAFCLLMAVCVFAWIEFSQRHALSKLPPPPPRAPNVLLIVLDTVRAQSLSLYGHKRRTTPNLERLAGQSVVFQHAIATSPWTLPTHASIFTGRYHHEVSADWLIPLDKTYPTLAEVLRNHGYTTAGFVANLSYCSWAFGLARGFIHYEDFPISFGQIFLSSVLSRILTSWDWLRNAIGYHEILNRKTVEDVNEQFLNWLSQNKTNRPFFAFLNYFDAHEPYLPPPPFDSMFGSKEDRGPFAHGPFEIIKPEKWKLSSDEIQVELNAYEGAIACIDHNLGLLFEQLKKKSILGNTLVIITSDHGEEFGEHKVFEHGASLYLPSLRVPLLIYFPYRLPVKQKIIQPVSLRDIPATVLDLVGIDKGVFFPGASLRRYLEHKESAPSIDRSLSISEVHRIPGPIGPPAWYPTAKGDMMSLIHDQYHYILNGDGREELYDIIMDPWETQDLANLDYFKLVVEQARAVLEKIVNSSLDSNHRRTKQAVQVHSKEQ